MIPSRCGVVTVPRGIPGGGRLLDGGGLGGIPAFPSRQPWYQSEIRAGSQYRIGLIAGSPCGFARLNRAGARGSTVDVTPPLPMTGQLGNHFSVLSGRSWQQAAIRPDVGHPAGHVAAIALGSDAACRDAEADQHPPDGIRPLPG